MAAVRRADGHVPLRDYAAVGDGRTTALIARDGSVDWLALPDLDSPPVMAACLDAENGGRFVVQPEKPFTVQRRYLPETNVLQSTFTTADGAVRVTDALTLPAGGLPPMRELVRRIEGLEGAVAMRWRVEPRFDFGRAEMTFAWRGDVPVALAGADALAIQAWDAGAVELRDRHVAGAVTVRAGSRAVLSLAAAHQEPLVLSTREEVEARLDATVEAWRAWTRSLTCEGPWREAVQRSALALKLLVFAPSGAVAAAPTTSLPEQLGGERNWDYRFSWVRDSAFALEAFLDLGADAETVAYFWWLMHAAQRTHPRLHVLYQLDGGLSSCERELPLGGYRGSRPVREGNAAADQLQLDTYGELMQTAWCHARAGGVLDRDIADRLAGIADLVSRQWRRPDAGIWEVRSLPRHFTQSKMMCWVALDRALQMAARRLVPAHHAAAWRREAAHVRTFVEEQCWSQRRRAYVRAPGSEELDASVLLGVIHGYGAGRARLEATVHAVREDLANGPFVRRYAGDDGLDGEEGAFVACTFWLVEALARCGDVTTAADLMDEAVDMSNDVGLYAEEIDPSSGEFLGNMPQALSHLALISAASAVAGAQR